jgi:hypothetical protein
MRARDSFRQPEAAVNDDLNRVLAVAFLVALGLSSSARAQDAASLPADRADALSPELFRTPPREAGVHVWWHWIDGAITRAGITKDLEVMKAQGVVQATILNVGLWEGRDFGVPRVVFASPEWFEMYRWALAEAARLGIAIGVHNCDGWNSSGGPWMTPELSMKQFAWTKTLLAGGGEVDVTLAKPAEIEGFYRDVAVIAYRTSQRPSAFRTAGVRLQVNGAGVPAGPLADGSPVSALPLKRGDRLVLASSSPLEFTRVAVHLRRPFMWSEPAAFVTRLVVETSSDGSAYQPLAELTTHGLNRTEVFEVPHASAAFVRLTVREMSDSDAWIPLELGELELLRAGESPTYAPSIPFIGEKTGSVKAARDEDVQVRASADGAIDPRDVVVLSDRMEMDGRLRWTAPAGPWAILRFGYTSTGARNAPATREGTGLECDKMDPAAVEHHFRAFPAKLISEAGEHAGKTLRFILVDSWEAGFQNWTARLPAEFEKRRGYGLLPWLPVLTGETVSSARESEAVLHDFRSTIADLIRESYYDRLAALLHERKVELHAEVIYGGAGYPPLDVLRATQNVDLPMLEFWTSANKDSLLEFTPSGAPSLYLPAAAAAGYGKPLVGSEAYTGFAHYSESPAELKPFGDRAFNAGVNRMILHSSVHQPTDEKPGLTLRQFASHFNRNNLYWPHASTWLTYQARIQWLLGQGTPAFDVFYFLGDQLPQSYDANDSTALPSGYAVSAVNADILATRVSVVDGRLRLNGSGDAALLSLPRQPYMNLETLRRLETLIGNGAHVYGPKPQHTLSLADGRDETAFHALAERIWGEVDGRTVFSREHGRGSVSWGRPIGEVLAGLRVPPQFAASPAGERDFLFVHRRVGDADVFFVASQWDRVLDRECWFRVGAKAPEIWDPETGEVTHPAAFRVEDGRLRLPVRFQPRQALVFVFRAGLPSRFVTSIASGGATLFPSAGGEAYLPQLRFEAGGVAVEPLNSGGFSFGTNDGRSLAGSFSSPEVLPMTGLRGTLELRGPGVKSKEGPFQIADLRSLTEYESPEVRYFSGEAVYRLRFSVPEAEVAGDDALRLDLGGFEAVAEVSLNGEEIGRLWKPGVMLDVTGRLHRDNELVVTVVNVYRNRFIGDLAQYGEVRNLRTSSPIGDFLSADRPLKRSGLFGPIRVVRVRAQRLPGL